jgi:4-hydroxythreonine-4-phosphate dehydrogenase
VTKLRKKLNKSLDRSRLQARYHLHRSLTNGASRRSLAKERPALDAIQEGVVERLRADGLRVAGPLPADTVFIAARRGDYDAVVSMFHDQGQIAMKLMGFERGVTVQGGLPIPIATPAHGTAFDIAGKGVANPEPIRQAFRIAVRMAMQRAEASAG